jgi:MarR family transcriptional regulator, organic hydroperoxide resistance regulator
VGVDDEIQALNAMPLLRLVALAGQVLRQRWSRIMSEQCGLTSAGANALSVLAWGGLEGGLRGGLEGGMAVPGRATHAELARRCWVRPATLTGVIDTLERAGYVRRERDAADRRVVWLALTDAGWLRVRQIGHEMRRALPPAVAERDSGQDRVIRAFLIGVITYDDKGSCDGGAEHERGGLCPRPGEALPEA